jgi:hypothetical protein
MSDSIRAGQTQPPDTDNTVPAVREFLAFGLAARPRISATRSSLALARPLATQSK